MRVGTPFLRLDRQLHGKTDSKSGNASAVLMEAMAERKSSDPNIDRSRTSRNVYIMPVQEGTGTKNIKFTGRFMKKGKRLDSAEAISEVWEAEANKFRTKTKDGTEKQLRSDAKIGFAIIVKPEKEFMDTLNRTEQEKFLTDAWSVIGGIFHRRGMVFDGAVMHFDEGNPHIHIFAHDPEYRLTKKTGLPFTKALNVTEFPDGMRKRGWDVERLTGYLEDTKNMTPDEVKEYKKNKTRSKKENTGLSARVYRAKKQAEIREQAVEDHEAALEAREQALNAQEARIQAEAEKASRNAQEAEKRLSEAKEKESELYEMECQLGEQRALLKTDTIRTVEDLTKKLAETLSCLQRKRIHKRDDREQVAIHKAEQRLQEAEDFFEVDPSARKRGLDDIIAGAKAESDNEARNHVPGRSHFFGLGR